MNAIRSSGVLLVLAACAAVAQEPPAPPPAITRGYDISRLNYFYVYRAYAAPPALGFPPAVRESPIVESEGAWEPYGIYEVIQYDVAKGTWEGENTLMMRDGVLWIRNTPDVHAAVAARLDALRARIERPVALELREVRGPLAAADAALAGGPVLDAPRAALLAGEAFTRVRSARLVGLSGKRLHRGSTRSSRYVRGYDVVQESGAAVLQPDTGWLRTGDLEAWRATLDDAGKGLLVEYRRDVVAAIQPHPTCIVGRPRSGDAPRKLELPRLAERRTATALWMPCGGQAIVEAWRDGDAMHLVVLGHVARAEPPARARMPSDGRPLMSTVFDAGFSSAQPAELEPSPAFEPDRREPPPASDEYRITKDPLVELVKETVQPVTWEDERSGFSPLGSLYLITNQPAVLDLVEALLRRVERARSVSILVRTQLLEASDEPSARALVGVVGDPSADPRAAVRAQLAAAKLAVRADRCTTAMTGHRALHSIGERHAYVSGYAARDGARTPTVGRVASGRSLLVRPAAMPGDGRAAIEVELRDLGLEMGEERALDDGARLRMPELRQLHRRMRLTIADGGAALVDLGDRRFLLVEARISRAP